MEDNKSYLELLGIDRPEKWVAEAIHEATEFMQEKAEAFQRMCVSFLAENDPEVAIALAAIPHLSPGIVKLLRLIFNVGYLKGLSVSESRATRDEKLKKLLGE